jgi:hypothetical protein
MHAAFRPVGMRNHKSFASLRALCLAGGLLIVGAIGYRWATAGAVALPAPGVAMGAPAESTGPVQRLEQLARTDHVALIEQCLENYRQNVADYTCTFKKQERIRGAIGLEQEIQVRFRQEPFSVAMTWVSHPPMGDRVLYVEGRNGGQMLVRPASSILRALAPEGVWRQPDGDEAKASTLRTVDRFGFERGMLSLLDVYRHAKAGGRLQEQFGGYYQVNGRQAMQLVRVLTDKDGQCPARKTHIYIDVEYLVPVMIEAFGWDNEEFLYRYVYSDIKSNVGLTETAFTPESIGLK